MFPGMPGGEAEGARCCAARSLPVWMSIVEGRQGTRRFSTCTDNAAAARSTVEALTFPAVTRTLLFDHTWQSSTKAILLVSSDASAKSPRRAPGTVTSTLAVAPGPRLGRSLLVFSVSVRVPAGSKGQA